MIDLKEKLRSIFGNVTEVGASYKVHKVATHFRDTTNLYIPNNPIDKLLPGMNLIKDSKKIKQLKKEAISNSEDKEKATAKSAKRAKYVIRCNTFEYYVTFTFAENRYDIGNCMRRMETWLENQKKKDRAGHFEYVIVIEFHKDGAVHFHALFQGYKGKVVQSINPKSGKPLRKKGRPVFDIPAYTLGHVEVYECNADFDDHRRLEYYLNKLGKYLNKEENSLPTNRKRFWTTRGLKRPVKEYDPSWHSESMVPIWETENEWGKTLRFTSEQIDQAKKSRSNSK